MSYIYQPAKVNGWPIEQWETVDVYIETGEVHPPADVDPQPKPADNLPKF